MIGTALLTLLAFSPAGPVRPAPFQERLTLLLGDGKEGFAAPGIPIEAGRKPYRNVRFTDLDGDGRCDLVMPNMAERGVTVLSGDGRGNFRGSDRALKGCPSNRHVGETSTDRRRAVPLGPRSVARSPLAPAA